MTGEFDVPSSPLAPVRGLVPLHNAKGRFYRDITIHRWLRLGRVVHKIHKADLLVHGPVPSDFLDLVRWCTQDQECRVPLMLDVSLRTDCAAPPPDLAPLKEAGLLDVFLVPPDLRHEGMGAWLEACRAVGMPARVQVQAPFEEALDPDDRARRFRDAGVTSVNLVLADPFVRPAPAPASPNGGAATAARINALARAFDAQGVEANLFDLPLCLVDPDNRERAANREGFFADHQQYLRASYTLAETLYRRSPHAAALAVTALLGRHTSYRSPVDEYLLKWLVLERPGLHAVTLAIRKLTRHLRIFPGTPRVREAARDGALAARRERFASDARSMRPECAPCAYRRVCDRATPAFRRLLPGLSLTTQPGETVLAPQALGAGRRRHFDAVDRHRLALSASEAALAREANDIMVNRLPDSAFGFDHYLAEDTYFFYMPGAVRWFSVADHEVSSTAMFWGPIPLTVAVTFGGGVADYVGFSIWKGVKLVCPMVAYSHRVALHIAEDGRYVLMRDGVVMRPVEFEGQFHVPRRLPSVVQLRLTAFNIDGQINTQNLQLWEGRRERGERPKPRFSVLIVSTRYARRLQAVLRAIAHQQGVPPADIEVIVGYAPGVDATDDLITSMQLAHPELTILRSTFPEQRASAKGLIINESLNLASGDWIVLLDSDIVLPPTFMADLGALEDSVMFAAPPGRKMLTPETTARILLGEVRPWEGYPEVLEGPGESRWDDKREGGEYPVGFCQCVRRQCLDEVPYNEYDHFEGADWEFAVEITKRYGPRRWFGQPVLHLDHGGSQWYGTQVHQ